MGAEIRELTETEVAEIRRRRVEERQTLKVLAFDFGIPVHRAQRICAGYYPREETASGPVIAAAAAAFGISEDDVRCLRMRTAVGIVKKARRAVAVVLREHCGLAWAEVSSALNRTNHATTWKLVERAKFDQVAMRGVAQILARLGMAPRLERRVA